MSRLHYVYISDQYGSKVMTKTTSVSIKSIMQGCKIEFLFGTDKSKDLQYFTQVSGYMMTQYTICQLRERKDLKTNISLWIE